MASKKKKKNRMFALFLAHLKRSLKSKLGKNSPHKKLRKLNKSFSKSCRAFEDSSVVDN